MNFILVCLLGIVWFGDDVFVFKLKLIDLLFEMNRGKNGDIE